MRSRSSGFELVLVVIIATAVLVPGIGSYSLVDPWETHYGEVGRMMLRDRDFVHTQWPGRGYDDTPDEGFRSKPVLTPWMNAAGLAAVGVARDGGYSGELVTSSRTMIGLRLPFVLAAIAGLVLMWWMLARLVNRRLAWLSLLVVGSCPFVCLIARQAIPDTPLLAATIGALALFMLAVEDGERPIEPHRIAGLELDARHLVLGLAGGFVVAQAIYYAIYFGSGAALAGRMPNPALWLPPLMLVMLGALWRDGWLIVRLPLILPGALAREPIPQRATGWRHFCDDVVATWDHHALDRYIIRAIALPFVWSWRITNEVADRVLRMQPITTMRQVYLLGCYSLLGIGVLAKGPPGLAVVGCVGVFHIVLFGQWRALYEGSFELKRGLLLMLVTFVPWHLAMFLVDGLRFLDEYLFTHILDRAAVGNVDKSFGTFEHYTSQLGHGMWLWAALLPAALASTLLRARTDTRKGRVRCMVALWAMCGFAVFAMVQTKFHHYILPAVPALGILVAFFLDDILTGRERLHPLYAALGAAIVLLVCRDLVHQPERWIEMFVYRYDRPWPTAEPWQIDPSDGILALGGAATLALVIAATRLRRLGVAAICASGLAIGLWALHVYMPIAGKHWGMREAMRTYYEQRTIYGEKLVYFGGGEVYDDWHAATDRWTFESFIPVTLQVGQPMTLGIVIKKATDDRITEQELQLLGTATAIGEHRVEITLAPGERQKLAPFMRASGPRGRPPIRAVDADRLIAWQLYWRGENFWSGEEIWGYLPDMKTSFPNPNNAEFLKYIADRTRMPVGRRYFLITEAGKIMGPRGNLPTQRAKDSYEVLDTTSNKFSLAAFYL